MFDGDKLPSKAAEEAERATCVTKASAQLRAPLRAPGALTHACRVSHVLPTPRRAPRARGGARARRCALAQRRTVATARRACRRAGPVLTRLLSYRAAQETALLRRSATSGACRPRYATAAPAPALLLKTRSALTEPLPNRSAVDVSPAMAARVIQELRQRGVAFVVAPFEADAQMAYMALSGTVAAVITEDSDLLAYGVPRVFFKMENKTGAGFEVATAELPRCREMALGGLSGEQFTQLCVLAGCDFVPSINGVGPRRAAQLLRRFRTAAAAVRHLR